MLVSEYIKELQKLPQDVPIVLYTEEYDGFETVNVPPSIVYVTGDINDNCILEETYDYDDEGIKVVQL
jgi:hypothetical protein